MALLASKLYDPALAVTKSTATAIAMTALDTTNLRLTFTVPSNGAVLVRMRGALHGATTMPAILFGVMSGVTVVGRAAPQLDAANIAATSLVVAEALFVISGLTPGSSATWDAAYSVETVVAATGIKYGGPNLATTNDAFGGFSFDLWSVA